MLDRIGEVYAVERKAGDSADLRAKLHSERSRPFVDGIRKRALEIAGECLPQSSLGNAVAYLLGLGEGLTRFLDDSRIPLDNNATERALRRAVVGREDHYGSRSQHGTEVAALFHSLIESVKLAEVDPRAYLREATLAALRDQAALLPQQLAA
jgi:transposase